MSEYASGGKVKGFGWRGVGWERICGRDVDLVG